MKLLKSLIAVSALTVSFTAMANSSSEYFEAGSKYCESISKDVRVIAQSRANDAPIYEILNGITNAQYPEVMENELLEVTKVLYSIPSYDVSVYGSGQFATDYYTGCMSEMMKMAESFSK